jgi:hypothetical protein
MRGYVTIFLNRKRTEYVIQPAARGPVSTTDFGEPTRITADKFCEQGSDLVVKNLLKYQTQVFDQSLAKRFRPEEYRTFLSKTVAGVTPPSS